MEKHMKYYYSLCPPMMKILNETLSVSKPCPPHDLITLSMPAVLPDWSSGMALRQCTDTLTLGRYERIINPRRKA